jgi:hypothetical protein
MARRVVLDWDEEIARVWWTWGSGSAAPYPGRRRAWFAFLREWVMDSLESVFRAVRGRGGSEACPLPACLRSALPFVPAAVDLPNFRTMCGAASILAPPRTPRGIGQPAVTTTT